MVEVVTSFYIHHGHGRSSVVGGASFQLGNDEEDASEEDEDEDDRHLLLQPQQGAEATSANDLNQRATKRSQQIESDCENLLQSRDSHLNTKSDRTKPHPPRQPTTIIRMRGLEKYRYRLFGTRWTVQFGPLERLWMLVFIDMLAVGLVIPLLPYYASHLGADAETYGYLGSVYGVAQLVGSPLMGSLSDRWGRVNILMVSLLASVVSYAMIGMANSLAMLFLSRLPVGILKQTMSISYAYVSDLTDSVSRAKYLGLLGVAVSMGFIIGPALGGVLSEISYMLPALAAAGMFVFDLVLAFLLLPDPSTLQLEEVKLGDNGEYDEEVIDVEKAKESVSEEDVIARPELRKSSPVAWDIRGYLKWVRYLCKDSTILLLIAASFASTLAFTTYRVTFPMISQVRFDLDARANGFLLSYMGILSVFVQGSAVGYLTKRYSEGRLVQFGSLGLGVSLCACALALSLGVLAIALVPLVVCYGVLCTCILSSVTKRVPKEDLGGVIGLLGSVQSLCSAIGPSLGGLLLKHGGAEGPGLYSGFALMLIFFFTLTRNSFGESERDFRHKSEGYPTKTKSKDGRLM